MEFQSAAPAKLIMNDFDIGKDAENDIRRATDREMQDEEREAHHQEEDADEFDAMGLGCQINNMN